MVLPFSPCAHARQHLFVLVPDRKRRRVGNGGPDPGPPARFAPLDEPIVVTFEDDPAPRRIERRGPITAIEFLIQGHLLRERILSSGTAGPPMRHRTMGRLVHSRADSRRKRLDHRRYRSPRDALHRRSSAGCRPCLVECRASRADAIATATERYTLINGAGGQLKSGARACAPSASHNGEKTT